MDIEFSTYYKSLTTEHRTTEEHIVVKAIEGGVIPASVRFGIMRDVYRGVIKGSNESLHYFSFSPANGVFKMASTNTPEKLREASRLLKSCNLGCDIIKAGESQGGQQSGGIPTVEEDEFVQDQQLDAYTDKHPAAVIGSTPDRADVGMVWHEEKPAMAKSWDASSLLDGLNMDLKKSTEALVKPVSDSEREFLLTVVGRSPEQISRGETYLNPTEKVMYQQWLGKSFKTKVDSLQKWLKG